MYPQYSELIFLYLKAKIEVLVLMIRSAFGHPDRVNIASYEI